MTDKKYIPVENQDGFYRDTSTRAIINTNKKDYQLYMANRNKMLSDKQRVDDLEVKVDSLKDDISDIKNLLLKIVDK